MVVRSERRPNRGAVEKLALFGVATTHEAMGRDGLLAPYLRPIYQGARVAGRAVTVLTQPGDNLMLHAAVEQCGEGDVLVVATTSLSTDGMLGELLATSLRARSVIGGVLDAGVRDVRSLTEMHFPVWARAISAQGTAKQSPGSVNVPVVIGGRIVRPGDVVVADDDGVVVVPMERVGDVAAAAESRTNSEELKRGHFAEGALGLDLYDLRETLQRIGVRYIKEGDQASGETLNPRALS